jgi:hypothetical protein
MDPGVKLTGAAGVAACAACCAVSLVPLILASTSSVLVGAAIVEWGAAVVLLTVPVIGLWVLSKRRAAPQTTFDKRPVATCDCGSGSAGVKQEAPIACTLDAGEFKAGTELIRTVTSRHLRHATRTALRLSLTYAPEAHSEVRKLVRMEQACCAFLTFDLTHDASGVFLTITAPEAAADDLFAHFAPSSFAMEISV